MWVNSCIEGSNPSFSVEALRGLMHGEVAERSNAAVSKTVTGR